MASVAVPPVHQQLQKVRRRLIFQSLVNWTIGCWVAALILAAVWFLVQPLLLEAPPPWLRWAVAGGLVGLATIIAAIVGLLKAPTRLATALSLDAEFGLKERVTTSLTLAPEQVASPAGQALLADVNQRVRDLDVRSRFPIRMNWTAALVPGAAMLLALIVVFYEPGKSSQLAANTRTDLSLTPPNANEIDQKMKELRKRVVEKKEANREKSELIKELEAELEKIANKPRSTKDEIRERVKEMTDLQESMQKHEKELAERAQSLKAQLKQLDKSTAQKDDDGPAKDLQKALAEGKLDKAREEIERLSKRLLKNELSQKEKEQLAKQLDNLEKKLERMAQLKDKEEKLRQANLDPETLKRELKKLEEEKKKLGGLQDLAKQLAQAQKSLKEGDMDSAAKSMSKAGDSMKNLDADEDLQDLRDQLARLQDAKDSC